MKRIVLLILAFCIVASSMGVCFAETTTKELGSITFSVYEFVTKTYLVAKTTVALKAGDTPLSILQNNTPDLTIIYSDNNPGYVSGITKGTKSYVEKGNGVSSGWMYLVNGVKPPVAANSFNKFKANDKLEWQYVISNDTTTTTISATTTASATSTATTVATTPTTISATTGISSSTMFTYSAPYQQTYNSVDNYKFQLYNYVPSAITYVKNNPGNFTAFALSLYERSMPSVVQKRLIEEAVSGKLYTTDIERLIINLIACKINPSTYRNLDFINKLFNTAKIGEQGLNSTVFALLIYGGLTTEPKNVLWNSDKLIKEIIDAQNEDGGFSLNKTDTSDVDVTAMTVTALSKYKSLPEVKASTNRAISWLSSKQNSDGTYSSMGFSNCESTSQVLISLCSAGVSLNDARFIKEKSIIDGFVSFYNGNAFVHVKDGGSDTFANEQALIAINACQINANPYRLTLTVAAPVKTNNNLPFIIGFSVLFLLMVGGVVSLVLRRAGVIRF